MIPLSALDLIEQLKSAAANNLILEYHLKYNANSNVPDLIYVKLFSDKCTNQMPKLLEYLTKQPSVQFAEVLDNDELAIYMKIV